MPVSASDTPNGSDPRATSGRHSDANLSSGRYEWRGRPEDPSADAMLANYDLEMPANESGKHSHDAPFGAASPLMDSDHFTDMDVRQPAGHGFSRHSDRSHGIAAAVMAASAFGGRSAAAFGRKSKAQEDVRQHVRSVIAQNEALRTPFVVRNLTITYCVTVAVVILLSIGGQLAVHFAIENSYSDANVVNLSGRQRMLSQLISKDVLAIVYDRDSGSNTSYFASELRAKAPLWNSSQYGLWYGNQSLGLPGTSDSNILALYNQSFGNFQAMMASVETLLTLNLTGLQPNTLNYRWGRLGGGEGRAG